MLFNSFTLEISKAKHKVLWQKMENQWVPFFTLSSRVYACHHGKDKMAAAKKRIMEERNAAMRVMLGMLYEFWPILNLTKISSNDLFPVPNNTKTFFVKTVGQTRPNQTTKT